jgi:serine/threonine-protein kinase
MDTVRDPHTAELHLAVAEGLLRREDVDALAKDARDNNQSPLALLVARGRLSAQSFESLRARVWEELSTLDSVTRTFARNGTPPDARSSDEPPFPVPGWDRYLNVQFLGQGGMGMVFLAVDPRLRREVAIKFLHGDNPDHVRRLISEARAQARVSHDRVCKVHEVGEVEGKVYIAMQYIDGKPLGNMADELTLEQKVKLVRGAVDGIHEAHRAGIIHRDIKPANIMIERTADGELKPYVMDFGLARAVHEDAQTVSGAVLGTPRYMAPEQASGEPGQLDRRADIYSLGATLYHLLTGQPPIAGEYILEVMHNLATSEPRPLRALVPTIPADLEAIVLKCLEKDRTARYDSARALGDDLDRYLNGEPVLARPAGAWYHLRKRLAKHRRIVAASAIALVVLAVAVGWAIQTRRESNERERLARRFTEQVERIEAMARYAALSRVHDITGDRDAIRARMTELEGEIKRSGAAAVGPGNYALGRGYLALEDYPNARQHLELAWQHGFREPREAYALALVMGHLYQQNLLAVQRIEQKQLRDAKQRDIEKQYRDPALSYLAASKGAEVASAEYVGALVAFYGGYYDDALRHVDAIGAALPWFYEAPELRGDIFLARALQLINQGHRDQARLDLEAGRKAYAAAAAVGESVPAIHESLGLIEYQLLVIEMYGAGDVKPAFDRVIAATSRALAIVPSRYDSLLLESRAYRGLAEYQTQRSQPAGELLAKATADAQRAVTIEPARPQARIELAQLLRQSGEALQVQNLDPSEPLHKAIEISDSVEPSDRDAVYYGNLGLIYKVWADYEDQVGADAHIHRGNAIAAYLMALKIDDKKSYIVTNLAINYFMRASQPRAETPDDDLRQAIVALEKSKSINPKHFVPYFYEGQIYALVAQRARDRGLDPHPARVHALDELKRGLAINAKMPHLHNGIGSVLLDQAKDAWERGDDPEPLLEQARESFARAIDAAPNQGFGYDNMGEMFVERAWFQRARDQDPVASVTAAVQWLTRAIELIPDHPTFRSDLGMAHAIRAAYDLEHGRDPLPSLAQASAAIAIALEKNPRDAQSLLYLGETRALSARLRARQGHGKAGDFEQAGRAFQQAIDVAPQNQDYQLALGNFCRMWAEFQRDMATDSGPTTLRGLALVDQVLALRPDWPDARALRASLRLFQAKASPRSAKQREQASLAAADLSGALTANPALESAWRAQLKLAKQLSSAQ